MRPTVLWAQRSQNRFMHFVHCQASGFRNPPTAFLHRKQKPLTIKTPSHSSTAYKRPRLRAEGDPGTSFSYWRKLIHYATVVVGEALLWILLIALVPSVRGVQM